MRQSRRPPAIDPECPRSKHSDYKSPLFLKPCKYHMKRMVTTKPHWHWVLNARRPTGASDLSMAAQKRLGRSGADLVNPVALKFEDERQDATRPVLGRTALIEVPVRPWGSRRQHPRCLREYDLLSVVLGGSSINLLAERQGRSWRQDFPSRLALSRDGPLGPEDPGPEQLQEIFETSQVLP